MNFFRVTGSLPVERIIRPAAFVNPSLQQRTASARAKQKESKRAAQSPSTKKYPAKTKNKEKNLVRADRLLSNRGWGSRKECFEILKKGRVAVEGSSVGQKQRIAGPSAKVSVNATLFIDGTAIPPTPLLVIYHKPKWVLSVMKDEQKQRPTIASAVPFASMHPVGRLDYDTSGLLLFSSNGKLTQRLLHPNHSVEKEYVAIVEGLVDEAALREALANGVETTEGTHTAELITAQHLPKEEVLPVFQKIRDSLPSEYNATDLEVRGYLSSSQEVSSKDLSRVKIVVSEGKHRMVRRMLANCGHGVVELKRKRQGILELAGLPEGQHRLATAKEEEWAKGLLKLKKIES